MSYVQVMQQGCPRIVTIPKGDKGDRGVQGTGLNFLGSLDNVGSLPPVGNAGDGYLINGDLYVWGGGKWSNSGPMQGPKGDTGATGDITPVAQAACDAAQAAASQAKGSANAASTSAIAAQTSADLAGSQASIASASSVAAGVSSGKAKTSETNAATSAVKAAASSVTATQQAMAADASNVSATASSVSAAAAAASAADSATSAGASKRAASDSARDAATSADALTSSLAAFNKLYLGEHIEDPVADNQGNPLIEGATYFNTVLAPPRVRIYYGGAWVDQSADAETALASAQLSATQAAASASTAQSAQTTATAKASEAAASQTAAALSATQASDSQTAAAASADAAEASEKNASKSASSADASASAASASAESAHGILGQIAGRNRIINGACTVAQRPAFVCTEQVNGYGGPDRFCTVNSAAAGGQFTQSLGTIVYDGIARSAVVQTVDVVVKNLSAINFWSGISQSIEGFNCHDLLGQPVALSFIFNTNVSGLYSLALNDYTGKHSYVSSFKATAGTPVKVAIPIASIPTSLTTPNSADGGMRVSVGFLNKGTYQTSLLNAWQTATCYSAAGAVNWGATVGNFIALTELQLEAGAGATSFERRNYATEFAMCQRYFEAGMAGFGWQGNAGDTYRNWIIRFCTGKRTVPTVTVTASDFTPAVSVGTDGFTSNCDFKNTNISYFISGWTAAAEL